MDVGQDQPALYSPFLNTYQSLTMSSLFPFPVRELKERQSQGRGLGLNSQFPRCDSSLQVDRSLEGREKANKFLNLFVSHPPQSLTHPGAEA